MSPDKPCPSGHVNRNARGNCRTCQNEHSRRWRRENPDKRRAAEIKYRESHPEKQVEARARHKARRYGRRHELKKRYGITPERVAEMILRQGGKCANPRCGAELVEGSKGTHVDHCHASGKLRAILCRACNMALGILKEDASRIRGLALYIETWRGLEGTPAIV